MVCYRILVGEPLNLIAITSHLVGSDTKRFFKYRTAFLKIQLVCDRRIHIVEQNMRVVRCFICTSNAVENSLHNRRWE